ncbi:MAG: hypothetical protein HYT79_09500 [Elusimicrobia bacterium]|nr:hypothetical protein [Elusimicrobiota bacterium]
MPKKTLAVKIESKVAERVSRYCADHGLKQGFFVEKAIEEKLAQEELKEDLLDFKMNKPHEKEAVSFEEYLARRR